MVGLTHQGFIFVIQFFAVLTNEQTAFDGGMIRFAAVIAQSFDDRLLG